VYTASGPIFRDGEEYHSQAEIAIMGLAERGCGQAESLDPGFSSALLRGFRVVCASPSVRSDLSFLLHRLTTTLAKDRCLTTAVPGRSSFPSRENSPGGCRGTRILLNARQSRLWMHGPAD
jgi:hypothetical protein